MYIPFNKPYLTGSEGDIVNFTLANRAVEVGEYMGKEPGDITPKFDYVERKLK